MARRNIKRTIVALFLIAALGIVATALLRSDDHACCHVSAQEPGEVEPGNPNHEQPTKQCNHKPKGNQVACKCRRAENCEEPGGGIREHIACKSFCFPAFCTCPAQPCD